MIEAVFGRSGEKIEVSVIIYGGATDHSLKPLPSASHAVTFPLVPFWLRGSKNCPLSYRRPRVAREDLLSATVPISCTAIELKREDVDVEVIFTNSDKSLSPLPPSG